MGHEATFYGVISGPLYKGDAYQLLQERNAAVIRSLGKDDDWPWLDASIFALPGPFPNGSYRSQLIHFALSMKDHNDEGWTEAWLGKFEALLRRLYWTAARVHIDRDFGPREEYSWEPTREALSAMFEPPHRPVESWRRSRTEPAGAKING